MNPLEMASRLGRKGLVALFLSGTMLFSPLAQAKEIQKLPFDKSKLVPQLQRSLEQFQAEAARKGLNFKVIEGYRTQERQSSLSSSQTGVKISKHTSGEAFDIAALHGGKITWEEKYYNQLGPIGEKYGLRWGGRWKKPHDPGHFELNKKSVPGMAIQKDLSIAEAARIKKDIDYITSMTDKNPIYRERVSNQLFRTAVHESGGFKFNRQKYGSGGAVSYFQIEPSTAKDVIKRWAVGRDEMNVLTNVSGMSKEKLLGLTDTQLTTELIKNERLAAAVARFRYRMDPRPIPASIEDQALAWSKMYQRGPAELAGPKIKKFISDNISFNEKMARATGQIVLDSHNDAIASKAGNATTKAVKMVKKALRR